MDMSDFLLARIAEDETVAAHADGGLMDDAHFSVERVLAECEAKRGVVEELEYARLEQKMADSEYSEGREYAAEVAVYLLATAHSGHPDFDEGWRP